MVNLRNAHMKPCKEHTHMHIWLRLGPLSCGSGGMYVCVCGVSARGGGFLTVPIGKRVVTVEVDPNWWLRRAFLPYFRMQFWSEFLSYVCVNV